jgi:hypothetical protein
MRSKDNRCFEMARLLVALDPCYSTQLKHMVACGPRKNIFTVHDMWDYWRNTWQKRQDLLQ